MAHKQHTRPGRTARLERQQKATVAAKAARKRWLDDDLLQAFQDFASAQEERLFGLDDDLFTIYDEDSDELFPWEDTPLEEDRVPTPDPCYCGRSTLPKWECKMLLHPYL